MSPEQPGFHVSRVWGFGGGAQGNMVGDFCPRAMAIIFGHILSVLLRYGASVHGQIVNLML